MSSYFHALIISDFFIFAQVFWFLTPPGVATLVPPLAAKLFPKPDFPLDFHLSFRGERVFGDHKTFRGLVVGVLAATLAYSLQTQLLDQYEFLGRLDSYALFKREWWIGSLLGLVALLSDAVKSFFKRRVNLEPGDSWVPFDQIDWALGSCLALKMLMPIKLGFIVIGVMEGFTLSVATKYLGFLIGVNKDKV